MCKPLSTKRSSLILFGCFMAISALAQEDTTDKRPGASEAHRFGVFHMVKVFPSFSGFQFIGGGLAYETGAGIYPFSLNVSTRYFDGSDSIGPQSPAVQRHLRFEIQGRYWPIQTFRSLFVTALLNVYSTGGIGGGGLIGYHHFISKQVVAEVYLGVQSRTRTEYSEAPILMRYGLAIGVIIPKMHRYGY